MLQRESTQLTPQANRDRRGGSQRTPRDRQGHRKNVLVKQMRLNRLELDRVAPNPHLLNRSLIKDVQQKSQPHHVIQMSVTEHNIQVVRFDQRGQTIDTTTRVKHQAGRRQKIAGGVALIVWMVTSGTQAVEFHNAQYSPRLS